MSMSKSWVPQAERFLIHQRPIRSGAGALTTHHAQPEAPEFQKRRGSNNGD